MGKIASYCFDIEGAKGTGITDAYHATAPTGTLCMYPWRINGWYEDTTMTSSRNTFDEKCWNSRKININSRFVERGGTYANGFIIS